MMNFTMLTKRGNKQQVRQLAIPSESALAVQTRSAQEQDKVEQQHLKRLVLDYEQREEAEEIKGGFGPLFQYAKLEPSVSPRSEVPTYQDSPRRIALTLVSMKPYRSVNCPHSLVYASFSLDCRATDAGTCRRPITAANAAQNSQTKDLTSPAESLHMHNLLLMLTMTTAPEKLGLGPRLTAGHYTACESLRLCSYSTYCL
jgi:hypothetical protein